MPAAIRNVYNHGPAAGGTPEHLVVLLHGLGANGRDLIGLASVLGRALPRAVFVSPDAPFPCDMVPPGWPDSYQWFSLQSRAPESMLEGVRTAAPALDEFLDEQMEKYGVTAEKTALLGFSQGTMMSLYAAPRRAEPVAGVLGYSGALIGGEELTGPDIVKPPVHLIHGEEDDVVPVEAYYQAREILELAGFAVTGHTSPDLAHGIDEAGIASGAEFLKRVLGG